MYLTVAAPTLIVTVIMTGEALLCSGIGGKSCERLWISSIHIYWGVSTHSVLLYQKGCAPYRRVPTIKQLSRCYQERNKNRRSLEDVESRYAIGSCEKDYHLTVIILFNYFKVNIKLNINHWFSTNKSTQKLAWCTK